MRIPVPPYRTPLPQLHGGATVRASSDAADPRSVRKRIDS